MYQHIEDESFWRNPERMAVLERPSHFLSESVNPGYRAMFSKVRTRYLVLGDPNDDEAPAGLILDLPPTFALPYHAHDCDILMVVIKGSLYVPGRVLGPGDIQTAKANEFYGPEVAGPQGCTRIEFFSRLYGALNVEYEADDSPYTFHALDGTPSPKLGLENVPPLVEAVRLAAAGLNT